MEMVSFFMYIISSNTFAIPSLHAAINLKVKTTAAPLILISTANLQKSKLSTRYLFYLLSMEPWAAAKKVISSVAVPLAPVRIPSRATCPNCYVSLLILRVIIRWYRGLYTSLLSFTLRWGKPRKPQLGDRPIKAVRPFIASNGSLASKWGQ